MNIPSLSGDFELIAFTSGIYNSLDFFARVGSAVGIEANLSLTIRNASESVVIIDSVKVSRLYLSKKDGESAETVARLISGTTLSATSTVSNVPVNSTGTYSGNVIMKIQSGAPANIATKEGTARIPSQGGFVVDIQYRQRLVLNNSVGHVAKNDKIVLGQADTDTYFPIWVKPFRPRLSANAVRCTELGTPSDEGDHVLIAVKLDANATLLRMEKLDYPSAPAVYLGTDKEGMAVGTSNSYGLTLQNCQAGIYEFAINPSTGKVTNNLASGVSPKISDTISASSNYYLKIAFNDPYEPCSAIVSIPRAFANVHLSEYSGGGVCFGGYSKSASEMKALFETYYPTRLYRGVEQIGEKNAEGSLWTEFAESSLQNGATTPAAYGCSLRMRKIEGKCIIRGSVMIKPESGTIVIANLPEEYKPVHSAYKLAACQGARIARIAVYGASDSNSENYGKLVLEWVRNLSDGDLYTSAAIWVDCSIEYWVNDIEET